MAMDNLLVTDARGQGYADPSHRQRLVRAVTKALSEKAPHLPATPTPLPRDEIFSVAPSVLIAEAASTRTTVVEVNARDRPGLLARLAQAIHGLGHVLHSAHIATYGERAVDVFYITNAAGRKLDRARIDQLRVALLDAAQT
jgi:[protein-PII] uridylyltransferase